MSGMLVLFLYRGTDDRDKNSVCLAGGMDDIRNLLLIFGDSREAVSFLLLTKQKGVTLLHIRETVGTS